MPSYISIGNFTNPSRYWFQIDCKVRLYLHHWAIETPTLILLMPFFLTFLLILIFQPSSAFFTEPDSYCPRDVLSVFNSITSMCMDILTAVVFSYISIQQMVMRNSPTGLPTEIELRLTVPLDYHFSCHFLSVTSYNVINTVWHYSMPSLH